MRKAKLFQAAAAALLLAGQLPYDQDEQLQAALELLHQGG